ncbi:CtsR family transcriptional regulator [Natroniella sulfidigena]|uniref:CtsR family transcriptional regulator n=1 Tax=Natroniella sulfidigena TaxID=723921 RepID=UPI00200A87D6|nr:CtsR family transcriptional regulator [Natroniella sulfidigena]MCK8816242.1 CtsR family transcriptional regulator [Natroniella sulfidigena]
MSSLSDQIANYLKKLLEHNNIIRVQRSQLASRFSCVPSQINYVLNTRFTLEKGYIIDSQRGGNGYIQITKVDSDLSYNIIETLYNEIGSQIDQLTAYNIIDRLAEEEIITSSEQKLLKAVVNRQNIGLKIPLRDIVRAQLLKGVLRVLIKKEG